MPAQHNTHHSLPAAIAPVRTGATRPGTWQRQSAALCQHAPSSWLHKSNQVNSVGQSHPQKPQEQGSRTLKNHHTNYKGQSHPQKNHEVGQSHPGNTTTAGRSKPATLLELGTQGWARHNTLVLHRHMTCSRGRGPSRLAWAAAHHAHAHSHTHSVCLFTHSGTQFPCDMHSAATVHRPGQQPQDRALGRQMAAGTGGGGHTGWLGGTRLGWAFHHTHATHRRNTHTATSHTHGRTLMQRAQGCRNVY